MGEGCVPLKVSHVWLNASVDDECDDDAGDGGSHCDDDDFSGCHLVKQGAFLPQPRCPHAQPVLIGDDQDDRDGEMDDLDVGDHDITMVMIKVMINKMMMMIKMVLPPA